MKFKSTLTNSTLRDLVARLREPSDDPKRSLRYHPDTVGPARHDLAALRDAGILEALGIKWVNPDFDAAKASWARQGFTTVSPAIGHTCDGESVALTRLGLAGGHSEYVLIDADGVQWVRDTKTGFVIKAITPDEL
jgi:hypothetical protein